MRVLITGPSGSGKTYLTQAMKRAGLNAVDADQIHGLHSWYDGHGNKVGDLPENAGKEFLDNYEFLWDKKFLEDFFWDDNKIFIYLVHQEMYSTWQIFLTESITYQYQWIL